MVPTPISFSPPAGRRWRAAPDEGLGEFTLLIITQPLTPALSPQAGRGRKQTP
jgi:hypothetical protein